MKNINYFEIIHKANTSIFPLSELNESVYTFADVKKVIDVVYNKYIKMVQVKAEEEKLSLQDLLDLEFVLEHYMEFYESDIPQQDKDDD